MRPIAKTELEVLRHLLSAEFVGAAELRAQARAIVGVESSCRCGCPSVALRVDRTKAPPARCQSPIPAELVEVDRAVGLPRTVICFLTDGYLADLECVYYDDALPEWPLVGACAVHALTKERYVLGVTLPGGVDVRPQGDGDAWVRTDYTALGLTATTWSGYRETFDGIGRLTGRTFTK